MRNVECIMNVERNLYSIYIFCITMYIDEQLMIDNNKSRLLPTGELACFAKLRQHEINKSK